LGVSVFFFFFFFFFLNTSGHFWTIKILASDTISPITGGTNGDLPLVDKFATSHLGLSWMLQERTLARMNAREINALKGRLSLHWWVAPSVWCCCISLIGGVERVSHTRQFQCNYVYHLIHKDTYYGIVIVVNLIQLSVVNPETSQQVVSKFRWVRQARAS
jgi:hypothetical protein